MIGSLTGHLSLSPSCLRPFPLLRSEITLALTARPAPAAATSCPSMNGRGGHDKEGAGWRAGLPGGRKVSSYIDCFRKRILQLLAAQLNKSGCCKGSDGISSPHKAPAESHSAGGSRTCISILFLTPPPIPGCEKVPRFECQDSALKNDVI